MEWFASPSNSTCISIGIFAKVLERLSNLNPTYKTLICRHLDKLARNDLRRDQGNSLATVAAILFHVERTLNWKFALLMIAFGAMFHVERTLAPMFTRNSR